VKGGRVVAVTSNVVAPHLDELLDGPLAAPTRQVEHEIDGVRNLMPNGLVRQLYIALDDARRETHQRLLR
jgi:hypothetical protein